MSEDACFCGVTGRKRGVLVWEICQEAGVGGLWCGFFEGDGLGLVGSKKYFVWGGKRNTVGRFGGGRLGGLIWRLAVEGGNCRRIGFFGGGTGSRGRCLLGGFFAACGVGGVAVCSE